MLSDTAATSDKGSGYLNLGTKRNGSDGWWNSSLAALESSATRIEFSLDMAGVKSKMNI
jgi:hypothetical protein